MALAASNNLVTHLTRLAIKTGRWPGLAGAGGRWVGRTFGAPMSCGLRLVVHNPLEFIQRSAISRGVYEPEIQRVFQAVLRPGDAMFDVGGNIGHHGLLAASCGAQVHIFEPLPRLVARIRENVAFNHLETQFTINNAAVGAAPGKVTLNEVERADDGSHSIIAGVAGSAHRHVEAELVSLNDYVRQGGGGFPQLIKIDVEGYEARVLDGASEVLAAAQPPFVVLETGDRLAEAIGETASSVLLRLSRVGYQLWRVPEQLAELIPTEPQQVSGELANYLAAHPRNDRCQQVLESLEIRENVGARKHEPPQ